MKALARVFALAPDAHARGNRYAELWRRHFYEGIQAALSSVVLPEAVNFTWARPAAEAREGMPERAETSERLWDQIRSAHAVRGLDAVISYCFSSDVEPALVARTVEMGVPWVNFFCDSLYAFDRVSALAGVTSLNWFPESGAEASYRALGRPVLCRPYALHPQALPLAGCVDAQYPLGFVGAPTGNRVIRLAALSLMGCRVAVRGEGWRPSQNATPPPHRTSWDQRDRGRLRERILVRLLKPLLSAAGGGSFESELGPFLSRCRVVLGLNEGRDRRGVYQSYLKFRDLEFPGYGCCYMTQRNDDVERAFDVGREVLTFQRVHEAAETIRRTTKEPARARSIGEAGRRRVLAEHTWAARLAEIGRAL
jgi:hypothetical protein